MLMQGARAVIARGQRCGWIERPLQRRPYSVVVTELANKLARTVWTSWPKAKPLTRSDGTPVKLWSHDAGGGEINKLNNLEPL